MPPVGRNLRSAMSPGFFSDSEMIQMIGITAYSRTTPIAMDHIVFSRALRGICLDLPSLLGGARAQPLDEENGDQDHGDEDEHRERRPEAQVDPGHHTGL